MRRIDKHRDKTIMRNGSYQGRRNNNNNNNNNNRHRSRPSNNARPHRNQVLDSNGPEGRVRGTAFQINEKYTGFAKDAFGRNDSILAENYHQHAEHYQRMINEFEAQNPAPKKPQHNHTNNSNTDDDNNNNVQNDAHENNSNNSNDSADTKPKKTAVKRAPRKIVSTDAQDDLGLPTSIVAEPKAVKKPVATRKTTRVPASKKEAI